MIIGSRREVALLVMIGLLIGIAVGLYLSWGLWPVEDYSSTPAQVKREYIPEYMVLIAERYMFDGDLPAAKARLSELGVPEPAQAVADLAGQYIREGREVSKIRALAQLAYGLGTATSGLAIYINPAGVPTATPTSPPSPTATSSPTFTPVPAVTPAATPTPPTSAPAASPTPVPSPTAGRLVFWLTERRRICGQGEGPGRIEIFVKDDEGQAYPNVAVELAWSDGQETIYTGLKPERGLGFADFQLVDRAQVYTVQLAGSEEQVEGLTGDPRAAGCPPGTGYVSWQLTFTGNRR